MFVCLRGVGFVSVYEVRLFFVSSEVFLVSQIRIFLKSVSVEIMILKMALILCYPGKENKKVRSQKSVSCAGLRLMLSAKLRN